MRTPPSRAALLALLALGSPALPQTEFVTEPASRLWIAGRTNLNRFQCLATDFSVRGRAARPGALPRTVTARQAALAADIRVAGLKCGAARMDRDLRAALRADRHPAIRFALASATVAPAAAAYDLAVTGELTIAGKTRPIAFAAQGRRLADGTLRASGQATILLTDYGVDPPRRLLGLVRVADRLSVHFDILLRRAR